MEGLLDSAQDANFICPTLVALLNYQSEEYHGGDYSVWGTSVTPLGQVEVLFKWNESPTNILQREQFLIADTPYKMVLGRSFLESYKVVIFNSSLLPLSLTSK